MNITALLLITVSILTTVSGFSVFVGSNKKEKAQSIFFFLTTICASLWAISIAIFLTLSPGKDVLAKIMVFGIYIPSLFMDVFLFYYISWPYKIGKLLATVVAVLAVALTVLLIVNTDLLYGEIVLAPTGNYITIVNGGWYYWCYLLYFVVATVGISGLLLYRIARTSNRGQRTGLIFLAGGLSVTGMTSLIFDVILPMSRYDLIWIGPLTMSTTIIGFYYAILRYRMVQLNAGWLKTMTYFVILSTVAIVYVLIFLLVFRSIFHADPSTPIIIVNFIMVMIMLLLMPTINEITAFARSLTSPNQIDLTYVVKRLTQVRTSNRKVSYPEVAGFLSEHLHFDYIGFLIDGRLYGSSALPITADAAVAISKIKDPAHGLWQTPPAAAREVMDKYNLKASAVLVDRNGKKIGQILFGKPTGRLTFENRDLPQIEVVVNLLPDTLMQKK